MDNVQKKAEKLPTDKKKMAIHVVVLVSIFVLGLAIGSNRINLGPDGVFRKSVQTSDPGTIDYDGIEELYSALKAGYDGELKADEIENGLKAGLVSAAGDPYTEFFDDQETKEFAEELNGSFEGIGAELGKEESSVVIISPIDGFPAQKAGLKARDIISKIDGESAYDISVNDAVKKIRGEKGTKVKLEIIRDGKALDFEITRDQISIPSVKTEVVDGIGIIRISRFGDDTVDLTQKAAKEMKDKQVKGVILDMRGNPGGLLDAAVGVSSLWLEKGKPVLEEKRAGMTIKSYEARGTATLLGMPTVVLVDEGSASASEITAGALRDNKVATIIGQTTYGKGSVQEIRELRDGGALKVTIARWYTPSGRNIDKEGIDPDKKVEISDEDIKNEKDTQKEAAIAELKK